MLQKPAPAPRGKSGAHRSYVRSLTEHEDCFGLFDPSFADVAVGPTGAGRIVAQCCDDHTCRHTVADANVGLNGVERPLVDHGGNQDFERAVAMLRALRPVARPSFVARYRVDDPNRLPAMTSGVALFERWRLDHYCAGLGVKCRRYIVGRAYLLGADALLLDQPRQRRSSEAQDRGAGSADFTAISGLTLGFTNSALQVSECACVAPGASPHGFANGRNGETFALNRAAFAFGFDRSDCHVDLMILFPALVFCRMGPLTHVEAITKPAGDNVRAIFNRLFHRKL